MDDKFRIGRGRKVAFWRYLAQAEGLPPPQTPEEYARLYRQWRLYGYANSKIGWIYIKKLQQLGYKMANRDKEHCVCSAKIEHRWIIVNHATRLYAYIGNECKEKFYMPPPKSPRMALIQAIWLLSTLIDELERVGVKMKSVERLLGSAIYYIEKYTKYRDVYVTKKFAEKLEQYTGIKWRWKTWESSAKAKAQ